MKLAFLTLRYAPDGVVGGAETLIRKLAAHSAAAGHDVHLLATCATDHFTWQNTRTPGQQHAEGMSVHFFPVNEDRDVNTFLRIQGHIDKQRPVSREDQRKWADNNVCSPDMIAWLEKHADSFDAIIIGPYLFGLILHAARVRPQRTWLVPCLHDEPFARLDIIADMFRSVRGCLFNAPPERDLAQRLYHLPHDSGHIVGMGMTPFDADPDAFAARHSIPSPYLLYCGRREGGKNTPLLLDYVDAYRKRRQTDLPLVLVGSGEYSPPESLRSGILDAGFLPEQEKHEAMAGAAAFIHPSTNESFGIVLLEAWLARTPALVHARADVLRWQCTTANAGLWFEYYPEFEAMLDLLLSNTSLNRSLGENGRRHVLHTYTWHAVEQRLFHALNS